MAEVQFSSVERAFVRESGRQHGHGSAQYEGERIAVVETPHAYRLGKLVTLRFMEWVRESNRGSGGEDGNAGANGVVALPTGKTPETFLKTFRYYRENWTKRKVQREVTLLGYYGDEAAAAAEAGTASEKKEEEGGAKHDDDDDGEVEPREPFPDTSTLRFVMLDEFFPMHSEHRNSFCRYIRSFYLPMLGIEERHGAGADTNVLTFDLIKEGVCTEQEMKECFPDEDADGNPLRVDLALLDDNNEGGSGELTPQQEQQRDVLQRVADYCEQFEERVRAWGGIGFFLGGIGPDGHVAFNMKGSDHDSRTRLVRLNYMSAAAAATDLGGIEHSRDKVAVTIGLGTITFNPQAVIIIMAAGAGKAKVVRAAVENKKHRDRPASVLHDCVGARFYVTRGAATLLKARRAEDLASCQPDNADDLDTVYQVLYDRALGCEKLLLDLTLEDVETHTATAALPTWVTENLERTLQEARAALVRKIETGLRLPREDRILHTAPHHDDIMLSYHAMMAELLDHSRPSAQAGVQEEVNNENWFAYLTSGFRSVTDDYMLGVLKKATPAFRETHHDMVFTMSYEDLLTEYRLAHEGRNEARMDELECVLMLRAVCAQYEIGSSAEALAAKVDELCNDYFPNRVAGDSTPVHMQLLKGRMRETEVDRMWALLQVANERIYHVRSKFYTDDYFTPMPSIGEDAAPVANLYDQLSPNIVTVAFDPEGTGPCTHYKVLQVVAEAIRLRSPHFQPRVWGYRNVWHRFGFAEANRFVPVTEDRLDSMHMAFMHCFSTQKAASFPAPDYDGPFSAWSRVLQHDQRRQLAQLLGEEFFANSSDPRLRNATGLILIREMESAEFLRGAEALRNRVEE